MKRRFGALWVFFVLGLAVVLAGCGGGGAGGIGGGAKPQEKFIGTWKLASLKSQGITVVGDFSAFLESDDDISLEVKEDGTGSMSYAEEKGEFTWELKDDNTITIKPAKEQVEDADNPLNENELNFAYQDGILVVQTDNDGETMEMAFTESGSIPNEPVLDVSAAQAVTSLDQIAGSWKLTSIALAGATMYGSPEDLAAIYGEDTNTVLDIADDGSMQFMGQDCTCTVGEDGAVIDFTFVQFPIKMLGDTLIVDLSGILGTDIVMGYTK